LTFSDIAALLFLVVLFALILLPLVPSMRGPRSRSRSPCASNLRRIHTACYEYASKNDGVSPLFTRQPGIIAGADAIPDNIRPGADEDPTVSLPPGRHRSVSQNLWLLVREGYITDPNVFVCPFSRTRKPEACPLQDGEISGPKAFVDFLWSPDDAVMSYSFIQPWTRFEGGRTTADYFWSAEIDCRRVIAADANNGPAPAMAGREGPPGYTNLQKHVNSRNHKGRGQNVQYGDSHVAFERTSYVGFNGDNIYTAQPDGYTGDPARTPGELNVRPANSYDTVLIPNTEKDLGHWQRRP